jgi:predicted DNA-binding transcriptional regulator AlpA
MQSELVSLREAAAMIRVCVRTVYRLIDDGQLPRPIKIRSRSFLPSRRCGIFSKSRGLPED